MANKKPRKKDNVERPNKTRSEDALEPWPRYKKRGHRLKPKSKSGRLSKQAIMTAGRRMSKGKTMEERSKAAAILRSYRTNTMTPKERQDLARTGARAYWDSMSPEERKIEMRRRAAVRKKRRMTKKLDRIKKGRG